MALPLRVKSLWRTYWTPGRPPRPTSAVELRYIYGAWLVAFLFKLLGASWDVAWHFKWQRDTLALPHELNQAGTTIAFALIVFHTYTGFGVDRVALRWMQAGAAIAVVAIPIDILNHQINGLDLTAWSPTHGLMYFATTVMLIGVVRGWRLYSAPGHGRLAVLLALFFFSFENVLFANLQQEFGIVTLRAWDAGIVYAEPSLLQFAADELGRSVDRVAVLHFALPIPDWVHPVWIATAGTLVLLLARKVTGFRWAATIVAAAYVAYRVAIWPLLAVMGFQFSAIPYLIVAGAIAVDLVCLLRLPAASEVVLGSVAVVCAVYAAGWAQHSLGVVLPPWGYWSAPYAVLGLAANWAAVLILTRWRRSARPDQLPVGT